jgi:hypothetical protein
MTKSNCSTKSQTGYFELEHGLPDEYYAITDGEISATVEHNGGINTIACLDILEENGRLYPDRGKTPAIFFREANSCGKRPLYGPAIQFISTTFGNGKRPGRNLFHVPEKTELYPFGFKSVSHRFGVRTSYDMAIDGREILFSFTNNSPIRNELIMTINKDHIYEGKSHSLKHQLGTRSSKIFEQKWDFIGFDFSLNGLLMEGTMLFGSVAKKVFVLIASSQKIIFPETESRYYLSIPWNGFDELGFCLTVADSREKVAECSRASLANLKTRISNKIKESVKYSAESTFFSAEEFPDAEIFSKTAPSFMRAMVLAETETDACIRAAAHKYGYFIIWDQVWPARAFLLMGDWKTAAKLIRYPLRELTGKETVYEEVYLAQLITLIAEDIIAVSGDKDFEKEIYGKLKSLFVIYLGRADENGLISASGTCGIDDPEEVGIKGDVWPSCLNSLWYSVCRAIENLALRAEDAEIAKSANKQAKLVKENYFDVFFNEENGYLYSSVSKESGRGIPVYQNVSTLGMDFVYGEDLLSPHLREIAEYQAYQLYHPAGRSSVAFHDQAHEMWKNAIMYQHISHEMRTARFSGLSDELERMMNVYFRNFRRNKTAIESHNLCGDNGDITQRANWQAFGARALYSGIFEALIGVQCHLGGFNYIPANGNGKMIIDKFRFCENNWKIIIDGEGQFAQEILIDNQKIAGTLQVPEKYLHDKQNHELTIQRTDTPFERPTLLSAIGMELVDLESTETELTFKSKWKVHTTIKIYCPKEPKISMNDEIISFKWDSDKNIAWLDIVIKPEDKIIIKY